MSKIKKIEVKGIEISIIDQESKDYISLTDMAKVFQGDDQIKNWLRNKNTIEFLGTWESLNNENFNLVEFDQIRKDAGTNRFLMSAKQWAEKTGSVGIIAKAGRYGGTYAHKDIAYHFGMWLSPEFQLLIIKEFDRLKEEESKKLNLEWDYRRFLTKVNYRLHTDSIKHNILPNLNIKKENEWLVYAEEADILNFAMFGMTAKQWKEANPQRTTEGFNIRDYADIRQLTVLANPENYNAIMVKQGVIKQQRLIKLRQEAISQLNALKSYTIAAVQNPFVTQEKSQKGEARPD